MTFRIALTVLAVAVAMPAIAEAASPVDPFRRLFRNPVGEIRRLMREPNAPSKPAEAAKPAAADKPPAAAAAPPKAVPPPASVSAPPSPPSPPITAAEVPTPRPRPVTAPEIASAAILPATRPDAGSLPLAAAPATAVAPPASAAPAPAVIPIAPLAPPPAAAADPLPEGVTAYAAPDAPHPRLRPSAVAPVPAPPAATAAPPKAGTRVAALPPVDPEAVAACATSLAALGISAVPLGPISDGTCGVAAPAAVASLEGGAVKLTEKAIVNCAVAGALAKWMHDDVQPAARRLLGGEVVGLRIAASYVCRGRNNDPSAQLSEHAFGNAVDISAVRVSDVGWIEVGKTKTPAEQEFLTEIRSDACGPFTTVLGPGVAYHDTHFHLDLAKRNTRGPSRGLYCR